MYAEKKVAFEFRSARADLIAFYPLTLNLEAIAALLQEKLASHNDFFSQEAMIIDLQYVQDLDLAKLLKVMQQFDLYPIAIRQGSLSQQGSAKAHRLSVIANEKKKEVPVAQTLYEPTLIITRPVRTGQQIYAKNRDLVVLDQVSAGAELIAEGSIHVYGPLYGRALAGSEGNQQARIFAKHMQAELLSIAGIYRTLEETLPESLQQRAVQVFLDKKKLVIEALRF